MKYSHLDTVDSIQDSRFCAETILCFIPQPEQEHPATTRLLFYLLFMHILWVSIPKAEVTGDLDFLIPYVQIPHSSSFYFWGTK